MTAFQPNFICLSWWRDFIQQEAGISLWSVCWIKTRYWQTAKESSHQCVLHVCASRWRCVCVCVCVCVCMCALQILAGWLVSESGLSKDTEWRAGGRLPALHSDVPSKDWKDSFVLSRSSFYINMKLASGTSWQIPHLYTVWQLTLLEENSKHEGDNAAPTCFTL